MKSQIALLAAFALVAVVSAGDNFPIDWFDCEHRAEGNYAHPIDCTRFLMCSNGMAYEMDCAICATHPVRCPQGRLVFDRKTNQCLFAHEAECKSLCDRPEDGESESKRVLRGGKPL